MAEALSREQWVQELALDLSRRLPDKVSAASELTVGAGSELTAAVVMTTVARLHADGHLLETIVKRMADGGWIEPGGDLVDAALAGIAAYRCWSLPGRDRWDPDPIHYLMLQSWTNKALEVKARSEVDLALRDRWLIDEPSIPALCDEGAVSDHGLIELIESRATFDPTVERLWCLESTKAGVLAAQDGLAEPADRHRGLRDVAGALFFLGELHSAGKAADGDGEDTGLAELREALETDISERLHSMPLFESSFLLPDSASELTLREAVDRTRCQALLVGIGDRAMANGLPDRLGDLTLETDWLRDLVFSAGARSGFFEFGPTAYLWLALEEHELPEDGLPERLGIWLATQNEYPVKLVLSLGEDEDPLTMRYRAGHSDRSCRWLALFVLSQRLTIDIFEIGSGGGLRLLRRATQPFPELAGEVESATLAALQEGEVPPLFSGRELDEHVLAGFALSENAKSELLLTLAKDASSRDLADARRAVLDSHVSRSWALYSGGDPTDAERRVGIAMRRYAEARSRVRIADTDGERQDAEAAHRELVAGFAEDGRALVHYNFKDDHIQGFWSANQGSERGLLLGEGLDLPELTRAVAPWLESGHGDVEALLRASEPLAAELDKALRDTGSEEIVVMPWAPLHGVPFAAIPLGDGVLGDRYRITYAPSLALLRPLLGVDRDQRKALELIAAHDDGLNWMDHEIAAARHLHPEIDVIADAPREQVLAAMSRARTIHLAMHGHWWRDDHFASALDLGLDGTFDRYVSAAEIHRDVDLGGTELVLLSACDTGRSPSLVHGVELYAGLDAAFLSRGARAVVSTFWPVADLTATLFMTSLHAELGKGATVSFAFEASVGLLRSGNVHELASDDPVALALDAGGPWRQQVAASSATLQSPTHWATFKLSGVPWLSRPCSTAR